MVHLYCIYFILLFSSDLALALLSHINFIRELTPCPLVSILYYSCLYFPSFKWQIPYMVVRLVCLDCFTQCYIFQVHLFSHKCFKLVLFYCWVIFHDVQIPHFVSSIFGWWNTVLFQNLVIVNCAAINIAILCHYNMMPLALWGKYWEQG